MPEQTTNDIDLLALIAERGAREAGTYLVKAHASDVYGLCRAIVRDRTVAEDLAHDVFARALVALPSYRGESSARTWLLTIARNRCFDHLRAQKRERAFFFDEPAAIETHDVDEPLVVDRMVSEQSLRTALESLDEGDRALVVLRHAHAMDFAELARVFGAREATIRMRLSRAVVRMKAALDVSEALGSPAAYPVSPGAYSPRTGGVAIPPPAPTPAPTVSRGAPPAFARHVPASVGYVAYTTLPREAVSDVLTQRLEALVAAM